MVGVFFVHAVQPGIGGMETHQNAFVNYFFKELAMFEFMVEKKDAGSNVYLFDRISNSFDNVASFDDEESFLQWLDGGREEHRLLFFLNDPWWIETVHALRSHFPQCFIMMRSGGNDVEKAPCNMRCYPYSARRAKYRDYINAMDCIVANSDYSVSRLCELGIEESRIKKIRGGVNTNIIKGFNDDCAVLELRSAILRGKRFVLLYACRFVAFKGIIESLYALSLSEIAADVQIVFIGDGPLRHDIEEFCSSHFQENQVAFVGQIVNEEVLKYMAASDIVVNASIELKRQSGDGFYIHTETMGRTMMEAVSVGTRILATDVGGTGEIFQENEGVGILTDVSIGSLTAAFNSVPQLLARPVKKRIDYSWSHVFGEYEKIFNAYGTGNTVQNQKRDIRP